jgi:uncharacterized membrane protein
MRAFAVLMMVQGHTVDVLLSNVHRTSDSFFYAVWLFMRGMTAPVFMFTAGTVFVYLFRLVKDPFNNNPRVKKGIKRFILLVSLGYLLRYPTSSIIDFSNVSEKSLNIFFAVDVLQLIGFGILILITCAFIAEKLKLSDYLVFSLIGVLFFLMYPLFDKIDWTYFLPRPIAGYFSDETGSLFPLFPWAGYVVCGGLLGSYLAGNPLVFRTSSFSLKLLLAGVILICFSFFSYPAEEIIYGELLGNRSLIGTILLRLGFVLTLNAVISFISISIEYIPRIIILIGRNTLLIYVVHLVILYGSAWNPGLNHLFEKSFNVWKTVGTAFAMITLMVGMVLIVNKLKIKNKQLVT